MRNAILLNQTLLHQVRAGILLLSPAILLVVFTLLRCSSGGSIAGGSGTGTGNGFAVGTVITPDGQPAAGAIIHLRRSDYLADTMSASLSRSAVSQCDVIASSGGSFAIGSLDTGVYSIEIVWRDSLFFLVQDTIAAKDSIRLPNVIVQLPGRVTGTVSEFGIRGMHALVRVYGMERAVRTDTAGRFALTMPEGIYHVKIDALGELDIPHPDSVLVTRGGEGTLGTVVAFTENQSLMFDTLIVRSILDSSGIRNLPVDSLVQYANGRVSELHITGRPIRLLPSIGGLGGLHSLEVTSCSLVTVPGTIGRLVSLTELSFANNELRQLPESIVQIARIIEGSIDNNRLCALPPAVAAWADQKFPGWRTTQRCP
jgi:hypothetical protein